MSEEAHREAMFAPITREGGSRITDGEDAPLTSPEECGDGLYVTVLVCLVALGAGLAVWFRP